VGSAYAAALSEAGLDSIRDLLWALPHRYVDRGSVRRIAELDRWHQPGGDREIVTVIGTVKDLRQTTTRVQRMNLTEALLEDGSGTMRLVWFNQAYLARVLKPGDRILAFGSLAMGRHGFEMRGPVIEVLGRGSDPEEPWIRRYLPLYRKLGPITGRLRGRLAQEALRAVHPSEEWLPAELIRGLPDLLSALRLLHQPPDEADPLDLEARTTPAHRRLATEELFAFALGVCLRRAGRLRRKGLVVPTSPELRERLRAYPSGSHRPSGGPSRRSWTI
jgi:ATP-dependent DNA helicase RecG